MSEDLTIIADTVARIFTDLADPQSVNAATGLAWQGPLWQALSGAGLTGVWLRDAGMPPSAGFEILRIAGHYACPVALGETMLAAHLLDLAGLSVPEGPLTLAPLRGERAEIDAGHVRATCRAVPFGATQPMVVVGADAVALVPAGAAQATPRASDMGGERANLVLDTQAEAHAPLAGAGLIAARMGAASRASMMAGALEAMLAITTGYTAEREAFGRRIGKFQAVQQNLARLAGEVAAALTAAGSAGDTLDTHAVDSDAAFLECAAAKIRCGEAAEIGMAVAHQAHGAIGWTQDHVLQRYSRRVLGWRDDFGTEADWAIALGRHVAAAGGAALWPRLTTR